MQLHVQSADREQSREFIPEFKYQIDQLQLRPGELTSTKLALAIDFCPVESGMADITRCLRGDARQTTEFTPTPAVPDVDIRPVETTTVLARKTRFVMVWYDGAGRLAPLRALSIPFEMVSEK
jgi:hypothetical protein